MKILFLSNRIPYPVKDGQSRRTYHVLKGLAQKNEVWFLSLYKGDAEIEPKALDHLRDFCRRVEVFPCPSRPGISMLSRLVRSFISTQPYTLWRHYVPSYLKRIQELLITETFDIVHCDIMPLAYTVRGITGTPCTLTDHDVCYLKSARIADQSTNIFSKAFFHLESLKLKKLERGIFRRVDMGIAVSEVDKNLLEKLCPEGKFMVAENGVDIHEFKPCSLVPDADTLLWVGGFGYLPNREAIHYFLERVYPLIKKEMPNITFRIVGGAVTKKIKKFAAADPSIQPAGYVDDVLPAIYQASVFVVPILSGSGTRLKTIEAMAAGKAIVTTGIGCEGIDGVDNKHYMVADTPKKFARSVVSILKNPSLGKELGTNARKLAEEKYDWEIIIDKIDRAYRTLAMKNKPAACSCPGGEALQSRPESGRCSIQPSR